VDAKGKAGTSYILTGGEKSQPSSEETSSCPYA